VASQILQSIVTVSAVTDHTCHCELKPEIKIAKLVKIKDFLTYPYTFLCSLHAFHIMFKHCLQCFDAVGWVAGRASGL